MIPDYCEALTAYRCWDVFPNGLLCGQAVQEPWPMYQAMVARCAVTGQNVHRSDGGSGAHVSPDGHWIDAPVFHCDCGIHAYLTFTEAEGRITNDPNSGAFTNRPVGRAWGALKLWGKLVEHEQGYRAQFAYPSALWCEDAKLAAKIAALYGVSCEVKALDRPKPLNDDYDSLRYWLSTKAFKGPATYQPITYQTTWQTVYGVGGYGNPAPPSLPSVIQPATLAQIKALGSSRHQKKAAAIAAAQKEESAAKKRNLIAAYLAKGATKIDVEVEA